MRGGIRLRHPSLRSAVFTVIHHRRYTVPFACPACGTLHERKTYHLELDSNGEVVVSREIHERLRELRALPLVTVGPELNPQPITIQIGGPIQRFQVFEHVPKGE
jgi:hypothetical protein